MRSPPASISSGPVKYCHGRIACAELLRNAPARSWGSMAAMTLAT
ncbi:MAG: hypothetical protein R3D60_04700 [Paracoccaceae bacterium]